MVAVPNHLPLDWGAVMSALATGLGLARDVFQFVAHQVGSRARSRRPQVWSDFRRKLAERRRRERMMRLVEERAKERRRP